MAKILDMPKLSPTMEEGLLTVWHKNEGDTIEVDDLLAEVETDKATMEFRSFDKGVLLKLLVPAGAEVKLGQPVAILGQAGEDISALLDKVGGAEGAAPASKPTEEKAPKSEKSKDDNDEAEAEEDDEAEEKKPKSGKSKDDSDEAEEDDEAEEKKPKSDKPKASKPSESVTAPVDKGSVLTRTERSYGAPASSEEAAGSALASPYVRKLAREQGITLSGKRGSGPHGRITPEDLSSFESKKSSKASDGAAQAAPSRSEQSKKTPLSPMRKTIAKRLTESKQNVPHFYLTIDVDVRKLVAFRETVNTELAAGFKPTEAAPKPPKVSLNDFLIKGCALALVRVPECNASFTPEALVFHQRVDISVAVAVPDGLVTPVVRDADRKSLVAIAQEVRDLAQRARSKKLKPEEMQEGTFSISNLGMFGIDAFSAVINPPEGAILAVGQVREVAIVEGGELKAGKQLALTLSCDHRVVDGAVGAAFLAELRALLEQPLRIVTG